MMRACSILPGMVYLKHTILYLTITLGSAIFHNLSVGRLNTGLR